VIHFMLQSLDQKSEAFCLFIHCWEVGYWTLPALGASASSSVKRWSRLWCDCGCVLSVEPLCVVMELTVNGSLQRLLRQQRTDNDDVEMTSQRDVTLTSRDLVLFAVHVAAGMEYVASQGVSQSLVLPVCLISLQFSTLPLALLGL